MFFVLFFSLVCHFCWVALCLFLKRSCGNEDVLWLIYISIHFPPIYSSLTYLSSFLTLPCKRKLHLSKTSHFYNILFVSSSFVSSAFCMILFLQGWTGTKKLAQAFWAKTGPSVIEQGRTWAEIHFKLVPYWRRKTTKCNKWMDV